MARFFWSVVCIAAGAMFCLQMSEVLHRYFSYPKKVTVSHKSLHIILNTKLNKPYVISVSDSFPVFYYDYYDSGVVISINYNHPLWPFFIYISFLGTKLIGLRFTC